MKVVLVWLRDTARRNGDVTSAGVRLRGLVSAGKFIAQPLGARVIPIGPGLVACGPPRPASTIVGSAKVGIELDCLVVVRHRAVKVAFGVLRLAATPVSSRVIRLEFNGFRVVCDRA